VIQVKAGNAETLRKQLKKSAMITSKKVIGFAPRMTDERLGWCHRHGYTVFRDMGQLLEFLKSRD
jgi:hypothetical protein